MKTYQKLKDSAKALLRAKFIAIKIHVKNESCILAIVINIATNM